MPTTVYATVSPYPVVFLRVKSASLKWAWKQHPRQGWCVLPPYIMHRLDEESKYEWQELMLDVEDAFVVLAGVACAIVDNSAVAESERLKKQTLWLATVEIDVMGCIFAAPKLPEAENITSRRRQSLRIQLTLSRGTCWNFSMWGQKVLRGQALRG